MSSKTALPVALLVLAFLTVWPAAKLLGQDGAGGSAKVVHPNGFGPESYARWAPKVGELDSNLKTNFAMLLVHRTPPTVTTAARAVVAVEGFDGEDPAGFTLMYDHLASDNIVNGKCTPSTTAGPGNPRWSVRYRVPNTTIDNRFSFACGDVFQTDLIMTGVNLATPFGDEEPLSTPVWDRKRVVLSTMMSVIIVSLSIQWDALCAPSLCPGSVLVDDISVTPPGGPTFTWTGPADNGAN